MYYPSYKISNAYATSNASNLPGSGYSTFLNNLNSVIVNYWYLFAGSGALNLVLTQSGFVGGTLGKLWTFTGIGALILGAYGFMMSGGKLGNTSIMPPTVKANYVRY